MADDLHTVLGRAETYWVSRDMAQIMVHASDGLDDLDRFAQDLWPTESGFLLFETPIRTIDVWGQTLGIKALVWWRLSTPDGRGSRTPGTVVVSLADRDNPSDDVATMLNADPVKAAALAALGPLAVDDVTWIADEMRVGPSRYNAARDDPEYQAFAPTPDDVLTTEGTNHGRYLLALLMLLNQTVTVLHREDLKPRNPKHAKRVPIPAQVTVIRLRRESESARYEGESTVEWHHRWVVRGHWRSQACGPDYALAQEVAPGKYRARIYIAPFIKGPEGLPLVVTEKVQALVR